MSDPLLGSSSPLAPALYQSSVYKLADLDALERISTGKEPGFIYVRDDHPNARMLAAELAKVEGATWAVLCGSGMAAVTATVLAVVQQGDRIIASDKLYGRTTQFLTKELPRFGVRTDFIDPSDLAAVDAALERPAKIFIVETISNPMLRMPDVPALVERCRGRKCPLFVDNTFATPALLRPLDLGADFVMESLTKMIGGHSDVLLGVVCGKNDLVERINQTRIVWGLSSSPFECWLAQRGLSTLAVRMEAASTNAAKLADWLAGQPGVSRVVYPGRADHPDHAVAKRVLRERYGNMLCFELRGGRDAVNRFMRQAPGIPFSPSLGDVVTTCSYPVGTSHRYADPGERARQGITEGLIRLSVGAEPYEQLHAEMKRGLAT